MNKVNPETTRQANQDATSTGDDDGLIISCEDVEPVVRKSFRVPLEEGLVTCTLKGKSYNAVDLSMYGAGLRIYDPEEFVIGETISSCSITFSDRTFLVDVQIIHISPREGEKLVCGLQIIHTHDAGYVDWMTRVIAEMKAAMLTPKDVFK